MFKFRACTATRVTTGPLDFQEERDNHFQEFTGVPLVNLVPVDEMGSKDSQVRNKES